MICLWCKHTPGQMSPEGIASHVYNYCSYVLNITFVPTCSLEFITNPVQNVSKNYSMFVFFVSYFGHFYRFLLTV